MGLMDDCSGDLDLLDSSNESAQVEQDVGMVGLQLSQTKLEVPALEELCAGSTVQGLVNNTLKDSQFAQVVDALQEQSHERCNMFGRNLHFLASRLGLS